MIGTFKAFVTDDGNGRIHTLLSQAYNCLGVTGHASPSAAKWLRAGDILSAN